MGTIKQGILGGFSGKVGTVVGSSWKGISYMRGLATRYTSTSHSSPKTECSYLTQNMSEVRQLPEPSEAKTTNRLT